MPSNAPLILIGPAGVGKSTVGPLVASALGRSFVDLDDIARAYYDEVGQPIDALVAAIDRRGFVAAHRWWQPARVHAVRRALADHPDAVIAFGAGHSHFEDAEHAAAVRTALAASRVVLLLPEADEAGAVRVLRERCIADTGHDWVRDGTDFLDIWVSSGQNRALADVVVHTNGRSPGQVAQDIADWARPQFEFRRVARDDFALLARWLAEPHVARWWNHEVTPAAVERDFGSSVDGTEPNEDHLVLLDGAAIGLIQCCRYADYPEYADELAAIVDVPLGAVSIDYLIGPPTRIGRGVGTAMIGAFVARIWLTDPGATCVIVPVNSANTASWRALLAAGFRLVGRGPLEPDNPIDDPLHEILRIDRPTEASAH